MMPRSKRSNSTKAASSSSSGRGKKRQRRSGQSSTSHDRATSAGQGGGGAGGGAGAASSSSSSSGSNVADLTIHFIRHGHVHNPKQVYYGRLPRFKLSARGQRQAKEAATAIASSSHAHPHGLKALYASPMLRARQTARCVEQAHIGTFAAPLSVRVHSGLNEIHTPNDGTAIAYWNKHGWDKLYSARAPDEHRIVAAPTSMSAASGKATTAAAAAAAADDDDDDDDTFEQFPDVGARVQAFMTEMRAAYDGGHVAAVSHGDCVFSASLIANGLPTTIESRQSNRHLYPSTASILSITFDSDGAVRSHSTWAPTA